MGFRKQLTVVIYTSTLVLLLATPQPASCASPSHEERFLNRIIKIVKTNYVREVNESELIQNAVEGLVKSVDPYAAYLTPKMLPEYKLRTAQPFGPLGLALSMDEGILTVVAVADDSPAYEAGIESKDKIVKLDDQMTKGFTVMEAWKKLDGPADSQISLTLVKNKTHKIKTVKVKRHLYSLVPLRVKDLGNGYLYVRISDFQETTEAALKRALKTADENNQLQGIILDLRDNPGGLLDRCLKIVSLFTDKGPACYAERRASKKEDLTAPKNSSHFGTDMAVLINEGTAGGAEVIAGALQDHDRALIFGDQSFGNASIQKFIPLSNGAAISLTTAYLHTPKGKNIFKNGITPDLPHKNSDGEVLQISEPNAKDEEKFKRGYPDKDPLVGMALKWLKSGKRVADSRNVKE